MRGLIALGIYWSLVCAFVILVGVGFSRLVGMPVGGWLVAALLLTWLASTPWRWLFGLSVLAEVLAITPPLALAAALWAPLLIWWLRGRIEVDLSFGYFILLAASAALQLGVVVGLAAYPYWLEIPWLIVVMCWLAMAAVAFGSSIGLSSLYNRFLHERHF